MKISPSMSSACTGHGNHTQSDSWLSSLAIPACYSSSAIHPSHISKHSITKGHLMLISFQKGQIQKISQHEAKAAT